jgi:competence protein ComEA
MFRFKSRPSKQGSGPQARVSIGWSYPAGPRLMLAFVIFLSALAIRLTISLQGFDSASALFRAPDLVIDPNTAPAGVLEALPHLGPGLVARLIAEREVRPFRSAADLRRRVRGLGPATLAGLAPHLRFETTAETSAGPVESAPGQPRLAQVPNPPVR